MNKNEEKAVHFSTILYFQPPSTCPHREEREKKKRKRLATRTTGSTAGTFGFVFSLRCPFSEKEAARFGDLVRLGKFQY